MHSERVYVKVNSDFDATGFVVPRSIMWSDGRVFPIDSVRDFRPASDARSRYTVLIGGEEKYLYFEKTDARQASRVGRWFVESRG